MEDFLGVMCILHESSTIPGLFCFAKDFRAYFSYSCDWSIESFQRFRAWTPHPPQDPELQSSKGCYDLLLVLNERRKKLNLKKTAAAKNTWKYSCLWHLMVKELMLQWSLFDEWILKNNWMRICRCFCCPHIVMFVLIHL